MSIYVSKCFQIYKSINLLDLKEDVAEIKADVGEISKNNQVGYSLRIDLKS